MNDHDDDQVHEDDLDACIRYHLPRTTEDLHALRAAFKKWHQDRQTRDTNQHDQDKE